MQETDPLHIDSVSKLFTTDGCGNFKSCSPHTKVESGLTTISDGSSRLTLNDGVAPYQVCGANLFQTQTLNIRCQKIVDKKQICEKDLIQTFAREPIYLVK